MRELSLSCVETGRAQSDLQINVFWYDAVLFDYAAAYLIKSYHVIKIPEGLEVRH